MGDAALWSKTSSDNDDADPTINAAEGCPPGVLNNNDREIMSAVAKIMDGTTPLPPYRKIASAFRAHRAGTDLTGISPSTFTKIPFPTEVIDEGGKYDASTSRWTPPAGLLMIGGQAYLSGGLVDQQQINLAIYKNGSALANLDIKATYLTNPQAVRGQIIDVCNGTDFYEMYIWANGAGNKTVGGNAFNTYFYGATL